MVVKRHRSGFPSRGSRFKSRRPLHQSSGLSRRFTLPLGQPIFGKTSYHPLKVRVLRFLTRGTPVTLRLKVLDSWRSCSLGRDELEHRDTGLESLGLGQFEVAL